MINKKVIALLLLIIVGVSFHFATSKDENFYYYYPGGFGDGELSELMGIFYRHAPTKNTALWEMRPIFIIVDRDKKTTTSSFDLLSDKTKTDIGFKSESELIAFIHKNAPTLKFTSQVFRTKGNGESFAVIGIVKSKDKDIETSIYHELHHYLDWYTSLFRFNGKKNNFYEALEEKLEAHYGKDIDDFKDYYSLRYNEQMAFLSSTYMDESSINMSSMQKSLIRAIKEDMRHESLKEKNPQLYNKYKQSSIVDFYAKVLKSGLDIKDCDFSCLGELYVSDNDVIDAEFKFLIETNYFFRQPNSS